MPSEVAVSLHGDHLTQFAGCLRRDEIPVYYYSLFLLLLVRQILDYLLYVSGRCLALLYWPFAFCKQCLYD